MFVPDTFAKNCSLLSDPVEGDTNAYGGEISTLTDPVIPVTVISALPIFVPSARLVAVRVTGFVAGTEAGARKSTFPAAGPAGAVHGFDPLTHTCPISGLPFSTAFTVQVTAVSGVLVTLAAKDCRWLVETVAVPGDTLTPTVLTTVTVAVAVPVPPAARLAVAWIVTAFGVGRSIGAVYVAVFTPVLAIVPSAELPPAMPFTSHTTATPAATQKEALNPCVSPSPTLADGGVIEFVAAQVMVTAALPDFAASATLVAIALTVAGEGGTNGAVYTAVIGPFGATVPTAAFPPAIPLTLQVTAVTGFPVPCTLAVNTCAPPASRLTGLGVTVTTMSSFRSTIADALAVDCALLTASTVTLAGVGSTAGAV